MLTSNRNSRITVALLWILALLLGVVQTWWTRHRIFSDGISYLEIAANYAAGNWNLALNAYWSPLYSWILALAFLTLHPAPYWQVATLHLVNFLAYALGLLAFSSLLRELLPFRAETGLSCNAIYVAGYTSYIFAGLYLIGVGYCSPDMIAMLLTILLAVSILRICRGQATLLLYLAVGFLFGLSFLARTAFAGLSALFLLPIALCLHSRRGRWLQPSLIIAGCALLTAGPFVVALSLKEHRFTLGDSGKLNYGWEISGAARSIHWQGEPYDIGVPVHPTRLVIVNPATYTFDGPVPGSYPPWYDPSFWYGGIQPKLRWRRQITVLFYSASYSIFLLIRSPVFLPCLCLAALTGFRAAFWKFLSFWPVLLPCVAGIALYCLVFVDKRYIASFLLIIWMVVLVSMQDIPAQWRSRASQASYLLSFLFFLPFAAKDLALHTELAFADLVHRNEAEPNLNYMLAKRFQELGLKSGDKIAYIGLGINADWARLDKVRIVSEIPVRYLRPSTLFGSKLIDDPGLISAFWHADPATQNKVLDAFRAAGARMVVTDGLYSPKEAAKWQLVLKPGQQHLPFSGGEFPDQENSRYLPLAPLSPGA